MKISDPQNMDGVIPAMITSFNKDESLNKEGIRKFKLSITLFNLKAFRIFF